MEVRHGGVLAITTEEIAHKCTSTNTFTKIALAMPVGDGATILFKKLPSGLVPSYLAAS